MNNTVKFRAQDEPLLRCRTLDLHLNVGTKVPYIPGIVRYADSTPTSSGKLKARLTSLYRDAESTLTRYQSPTNGRSVSLITLGGLPYIGNRGSLLHLFTSAGVFRFLPRRPIRLPCEEPGAPVLWLFLCCAGWRGSREGSSPAQRLLLAVCKTHSQVAGYSPGRR